MPLPRRRKDEIRLRVPCSTSNVGPGFDAFSIALNAYLTVSWRPAEKTTLTRHGALAESLLSAGRDPVLRGMRRASILAGQPLPPGELLVDGDFPPGRGLGASGSGLVAGLLLGNRLCGERISEDELLIEGIELEGNPENAVGALFGGAHWSIETKRGEWRHIPVVLHRDLRFLIVVPPYPLETKRSREVLPTSVGFGRAMRQAHRTPVLLEGLRLLDPELIAAGIQDELHIAPRLKLLTGASGLLEYANNNGALGATLSGAGSGLLIVTRMQDAVALEKRLASRVKRLWGKSGHVLSTKLEPKGAAFI